MNTPTTSALIEQFHAVVSAAVGERGVYPSPLLYRKPDGGLVLCSLALRPAAAYAYVLKLVRGGGAAELAFGLDRYAKPGQGTTLGDLVAGGHYAGGGWRPFVIEYRHAPRQVRPVDYGNAFWRAAVLKELARFGWPATPAAAEGGAA